ncbi:hypothetical protein T492DRAFT_848706 [Pavlovales sp. CCMP2436]|nr:hypothetical protein T492DRAFT_848706 [Pavlovales sp. CCMP2436]
MPYLTHASGMAAKAAKAEAAARSKIAVTAPARKPVIAATAPARDGEAERIDMCAEEKREEEEEEEERNAETILCTWGGGKFLLFARLRRLGGGEGTVCARAEPELCAGGGAGSPWQGLQDGRKQGRQGEERQGAGSQAAQVCVGHWLPAPIRGIDDGKHADELDERLRLIPHDRILHHCPEQGHLARQSRRCCNGKQPGPGEWSPKEVRQSPTNRSSRW